jgi:hypothetical protein
MAGQEYCLPGHFYVYVNFAENSDVLCPFAFVFPKLSRRKSAAASAASPIGGGAAHLV